MWEMHTVIFFIPGEQQVIDKHVAQALIDLDDPNIICLT